MKTKIKFYILQLCVFIVVPIVLLITPVDVVIKPSSNEDNNRNLSSFEIMAQTIENYRTKFQNQRTNFTERRKNLDAVCQKYSHPYRPESRYVTSQDLAHIRNFNYFSFNQKYTMICSIHKVGSNSMHNFLLHILEKEWKSQRKRNWKPNDGLVDPVESDRMKLPVTEDCWLECAKNHTNVILVRHPLERLLSAYLYIFQNSGRFHDNKYSWEAFVQNLITHNIEDKEWKTIQDKVGDHWQPYWHNCQVCDLNLRPKYILKLETMQEDIKDYLSDLGLDNYSSKFPWVNSHKSEIATSLRVIEFYSRLNRTTIQKLYEFYKLDHELFDYDPEYYLSFAKDLA